MTKYKLLTGIYFPSADEGKGASFPAGQVVDMNDDKAAPYVERGSLVKHDPEAEAEAAKPKPIEGEVVQEFELDGYTYKHLDTTEGDKYTLDGVEVDSNAFVNAYQSKVVADQQEEKNEDTETTGEEVKVNVTTPPTEEQILNDPQIQGENKSFLGKVIDGLHTK